MFDRVDHIGVLVDDYAAMVELFGALGVSLSRESFHEPSNRRMAMFDCGNTSVEIIEDLDPQSKASNLRGQRVRIDHIAFEIGDVEAMLPELTHRGVTPDKAGIDSSSERLSFFSHPSGFDGLSLQVVSYPSSDA